VLAEAEMQEIWTELVLGDHPRASLRSLLSARSSRVGWTRPADVAATI
jgi:hypothetical protein